MRAMRLHRPAAIGDRPLLPENVPVPAVERDSVLIRVHVCGVCRTDLHVVEGDLPSRKLPLIPGHQVVGTVADRGSEVEKFAVGDRVGAAWLHRTCGVCQFCHGTGERENLCINADFTGWTADGGYAEYMTVPAAYAYGLPEGFSDEQSAPLLCAGVIGYRALRLCGVRPGERLGLYGFGASAHVVIQLARHLGCEVLVFTRGEANRQLARSLGATWVGGSDDIPPARPQASIIFAPAGSLLLYALEHLEKGGTVALAGIHMSNIPPLDYRRHLYDEKVVRSVANASRRDAFELLARAVEVPVRTSTRIFPLADANEALLALKTGGVTGAAVLACT